MFLYRTNPLNISSSGNDDLKMEAVIKMFDWIFSFINSDEEVNHNIEFKVLLNKRLNKYIVKKKVAIISNSLFKKGIFHVLYWYKKRNRYNYSIKELVFSLFEYAKTRFTKNSFN